MTSTWVLVSDSSRARVLAVWKPLGEAYQWETVREFENPAGRARTSDLVSDRQGRVRQSATGATPAMAARHDAAEVESERFAAELGQFLEHAFGKNDFEQVVLVAPPRFLGVLRQKLGDPVSRSVRLSVDKDYTHLEARDLEQRLETLLSA